MQDSCRVCLALSFKFIKISEEFNGRLVKKIIEDLASVEIKENAKLPKYLCEKCLTGLIQAETIIATCKRNDEFLNELASVEDEREASEEREIIMEVVTDEKGIIIAEVVPDFIEESPSEISSLRPSEFFKSHRKTPKKSHPSIKFQTTRKPVDIFTSFEALNEESKLKSKPHQNIKFFCSFCGKECSNRRKLSYHETTKHSKVQSNQPTKKYTCDRCGVMLKEKCHVTNHMNVIHLKVKRFKCQICHFEMYSKTHFTSHMKTHANIRDFKCELCDKTFARKETLKVHLKTHKGVRDYVCKHPHCNKAYTSHTELKKHIFKHNDQNLPSHPYICQICQAGFNLKRKLVQHANESHKGVDTSSWLNGKTSWIKLIN